MELTQRSAPSGSAQVRKFHLPPALSIISLQQSKMQDVEQKLQPYIFAPELSPFDDRGLYMKLFADQEDEHYGEYITAELNKTGREIAQVTKKWFRIQKLKEQMQAEPHEWIQINFLGPHGDRIEILKIGRDIEAATVAEFKDSASGQLYGMYSFKAGKEEHNIVAKRLWDYMKEKLAKMQPFIDAEVHRAIYGEDDT